MKPTRGRNISEALGYQDSEEHLEPSTHAAEARGLDQSCADKVDRGHSMIRGCLAFLIGISFIIVMF